MALIIAFVPMITSSKQLALRCCGVIPCPLGLPAIEWKVESER
jgi:hypothetical protein